MAETLKSSREMSCEITIPAPVNDIWLAWTTEEGAISFFTPACRIDLKPGGAYEMLFNLEGNRKCLKSMKVSSEKP